MAAAATRSAECSWWCHCSSAARTPVVHRSARTDGISTTGDTCRGCGRRRPHNPDVITQRASLVKRLPTRELPEPDTPATLHVSRPDEMILVVPHLLGFWPDRSIVVVVLVEGRVEVTARADLDCSPAELSDVIRPLVLRYPDHRVLLIGYGPRAQAREAVDLCAMLFAPEAVVDRLGTDGRRWWSHSGAGGRMSADALREIARTVPLLAEGLLPDRSALEQAFGGPDGAVLARSEARLETLYDEVIPLDRSARMARVGDLIRHAVAAEAESGLHDDQRLELAVLVQDIAARDAAWMLITRADAAEHLALWRSVVELTPDAEAPPVLCLAATAGWLTGNGAIMNICLERALTIRPTYGLAGLLTDVMHQAIPPQAWDELAGTAVDPAEYGDEP